MIGSLHLQLLALRDELDQSLTEESLRAAVEVGRVISTANEKTIRDAIAMIDSVLSKLGTSESLQGYKESANLGDYLESTLHMHFTCITDDMLGDGVITRDQRIALSNAIGSALDTFHANVARAFPEAYTMFYDDDGDAEESSASKSGIEEATQTVDGKAFPASDFAYVPDANTPSTWKLRLTATPGGPPDSGIVGAAVAALGPGFRGQKVQIPSGDLAQVKAKVRAAWRRANPDKSAADMPDVIKEAEYAHFQTEEIRFSESGLLTREDGAKLVKIIQPGQGSSGYYGAEVLKNDGPRIFPIGTHMYFDHPSKTEERDRPERSVKDLAAVTVETPVYDKQGKYGEGLYTWARVLSNHADHINEMAPYIGVSIRGAGIGKPGVVDGKKTYVFEKLTHGESIDLVTHAGAGGALVSEEDKTPKPELVIDPEANAEIKEAKKEVIMPEPKKTEEGKSAEEISVFEEVARLQETAKAQADLIAKLTLRESVRAAADCIDAEMNRHPRLPVAMKERIKSNALTNVPVREDGTLDTEKLTARVKEAVDEESRYIQSIGVSPIRGMGASESSVSVETTEESAKADFKKALVETGMTERQAELALGGYRS